MELTNASMHGLAAAAFAFMYALGGSVMALLGALHPLWRWNMVVMAVIALVTMVTIATTLPESPLWLVRKDKDSELELAMKEIMGNEEYIQEVEKKKLAHKKNMGTAKGSNEMGKTWSVPLASIVADFVKGKKKLPEPPLSFVFLVLLYICIGWSGLTYVTLNGPKLFKVIFKHQVCGMFSINFCCRIRHETWALTNST